MLLACTEPSPPPVFLQSHDGKFPLVKTSGLASQAGPGQVFPRLSASRLAANDSVSDPTGGNWRR